MRGQVNLVAAARVIGLLGHGFGLGGWLATSSAKPHSRTSAAGSVTAGSLPNSQRYVGDRGTPVIKNPRRLIPRGFQQGITKGENSGRKPSLGRGARAGFDQADGLRGVVMPRPSPNNRSRNTPGDRAIPTSDAGLILRSINPAEWHCRVAIQMTAATHG